MSVSEQPAHRCHDCNVVLAGTTPLKHNAWCNQRLTFYGCFDGIEWGPGEKGESRFDRNGNKWLYDITWVPYYGDTVSTERRCYCGGQASASALEHFPKCRHRLGFYGCAEGPRWGPGNNGELRCGGDGRLWVYRITWEPFTGTFKRCEEASKRYEEASTITRTLVRYHWYKEKLDDIAYLTGLSHRDINCFNDTPIDDSALAKLAGVPESIVSKFFERVFGSYSRYQEVCYDRYRLLKILRDGRLG